MTGLPQLYTCYEPRGASAELESIKQETVDYFYVCQLVLVVDNNTAFYSNVYSGLLNARFEHYHRNGNRLLHGSCRLWIFHGPSEPVALAI